MTHKRATTIVPIHDLFARRWSPRAFDPNRPVSREQIVSMLEAARWAPSCFSDEPWRFLVFDRASDEAGWTKALHTLSDKNQRWARNAPVLIAAVAQETFTRNEKANRWAQYDTGAAMMSLVLQATALGLATRQIGGFDADRVRQIFGVPRGFVTMAFVAVGYSGDLAQLEPEFHAGELAPRKRIPLAKIGFAGEWERPLDGA